MENNIFTKLYDWAEERTITQQPHDKNGFVANLVSELKEYIESDYYGKVDSLCDTVVFCATELPKLGFSKEAMSEKYDDVVIKRITDYKTHEEVMIDFLGDIVDTEFTESKFDAIVGYCFSKLNYMGIDFEIAMEETFKEIDSRRGAWNDEVKKWKKFTDDEHKALWYSADYSKAKRS